MYYKDIIVSTSTYVYKTHFFEALLPGNFKFDFFDGARNNYPFNGGNHKRTKKNLKKLVSIMHLLVHDYCLNKLRY